MPNFDAAFKESSVLVMQFNLCTIYTYRYVRGLPNNYTLDEYIVLGAVC